ncbi:alpha/beta fold hydrolase [Mangrovactinospora gilvigrisea]|uniref:alpha/beta fold hydrolase n=1 Tax=Mangrovactinospora gilvigrisea TaxID=1428644 RepID=UPI000AD28062|nr:alpha/beta hydrolase [Mangrovactinospora gilvigrisea]
MATDVVLRIDGRRVHCRRWGPPGRHPLLLVHGYPGHTRIWDRFAAEMRGRHSVVAVDLAGHGESDWADDYCFDGWVADLHAVATALELPPFTFLGHSMGATLGFCFTEAHPEMLDRLVAVDGLPAGAWEPTTPNAGALPPGFADLHAFARCVGVDPADLTPDHPHRHLVRPGADGGLVWRHDLAVRDAVLRELRFDTVRWHRTAARIRTPVTYLRCGLTHVGDHRQTAAVLRHFPTCDLVTIPDSEHSLPTRRPDLLLAAVRRIGL